MIDAPINNVTIVEIYAATADALEKWEPRLVVRRVVVESVGIGVGSLILSIDGEHLPTGERIQLGGLAL